MISSGVRASSWLLMLCAVGCVLCAGVHAEVPKLIRYHGQAVDSQGVPLEGPYDLTFRLYDAATGGTQRWQERHAQVPLAKGQFNVLLGSVTPLTVDWSQALWLSVQVGADPELTPRQQITSVPLAVRAEVAESAQVADQLRVPVTTSTITDDANRLVPAGAILLWRGASCPTGYTRVADYDNFFLMVSATAGTTGGSNAHDHGGVTGSHVLTTSEIPSHTHLLPTDSCGSADNPSLVGTDNNDESYDPACAKATSATGGSSGHSHPMTSADSRPAFKTILLCQKE